MSIDKRTPGAQPGGTRLRLRRQGLNGTTPAGSASKDANGQRGFDPYNSGSFDRRNNWTRVGKR